MRLCLAIVILFLATLIARPATIPAASASESDVIAAIALASDGDTVTVPAGTVGWSSRMSYSKGINLIGAGSNSITGTIITNVVNKSGNVGNPLITISTTLGKFYRVSGFFFTSTATNEVSANGQGTIQMTGTSRSIRIDHNYFYYMSDVVLVNFDSTCYLFDHNTSEGIKSGVHKFYSNTWLPGDTGHWGDGSWSVDMDWGTTNMSVCENNFYVCHYVVSSPIALTDAYGGARFCMRYNTIINFHIEGHGTGSTLRYRGTRAFEVYENVFTNTTTFGGTPVFFRSGTGTVYSNTAVGPWSFIGFATGEDYRGAEAFQVWAGADGTNSWDTNIGGVLISGISTGPNNTSGNVGSCKLAAAGWTADQFKYCTIRDLSLYENPATFYAPRFSTIISNSTDTIYWMQASSHYGLFYAAIGDSFEVRYVRRSIDCVGNGTGDFLSNQGATPTNSAIWLNQTNDPVYCWSNTVGGSNNEFAMTTSMGIRPNTNYINDVPRPGYTPLIYPHPLDLPQGTNLTLSFLPNPAVVGQIVTVSGAIQTNTVTDTSVNVGNVNVTITGLGFLTPAIAAGTYSTATIPSTANTFPASAVVVAGGTPYNGLSTSASLVVNLNPTTGNITSAVNPSSFGTPTPFIYSLKTNSVSPSDMTGTMSIFADGVLLGSGSPSSTGTFTNTANLAVGIHNITGTYTGNSKYATNYFSGLVQTVGAASKIFYPPFLYAPNATYYISTQATGVFASSGAKGTPAIPLDGSTYANFDANMNAVPQNSKIYLTDSGTYQTMGEFGFRPKTGQTITGMGMNLTVLQFPDSLITDGTLSNATIIRGGDSASNITVMNITLDDNYQSGVTESRLSGATLYGANGSLINVKSINSAAHGAAYTEAFALNIFNSPTLPGPAVNALISGCVVTNFTRDNNNNLSAINMNGVAVGNVINCSVGQDTTNVIFGYNMSGSDITVSNCASYGTSEVSHEDAVNGSTNLIFVGCLFTNVSSIANYTSGSYSNIIYENCNGNISRVRPSDQGIAFIIKPPGGLNYMLLSSNRINSVSNTNGVLALQNNTNVIIQANALFVTNPTTNQTNYTTCGTITYIGNSNFVNTVWP